MKHVMVDLEMWDDRPTGRISQVAACVFDTTGFISAEICLNIDPASWPETAFTTSVDTLRWMVAKGVPFTRPQEMPYGVAMVHLAAFLRGSVPEQVIYWGKGAGFDQRALEHAFETCGLAAPWHYWQWLDVRTETRHLPKATAPNAHDALADCKFQISRVLEVWGNE